jgi:hypothetical protein
LEGRGGGVWEEEEDSLLGPWHKGRNSLFLGYLPTHERGNDIEGIREHFCGTDGTSIFFLYRENAYIFCGTQEIYSLTIYSVTIHLPEDVQLLGPVIIVHIKDANLRFI